ncbi:MAG: SDR family NAD(P)-dependent oxidoreductase [Pseudomonadota bacterium]
MSDTTIYLLTGATAGLGLQATAALLQNPKARIVTGVRAPERRARFAGLPQDRVTRYPLDLASLRSVEQFCAAVRDGLGDQHIEAIGLNAGVQITTGLEMSEDGYEKTFAVNHLAHWLIRERLIDRVRAGGRVVVTCSGTHDPDDRVARSFGFRGGVFPCADIVATGALDLEANPAQACLDRYATSKMANVLQASHWAQTDPDRPTVLFDPGLMPGTDLARDRSAIEQFAWNTILPALGFLMRGVSSAQRSGRMLAALMAGERKARSGDYVEYSGRLLQPWSQTNDPAMRADLDDTSRRLVSAAMAA